MKFLSFVRMFGERRRRDSSSPARSIRPSRPARRAKKPQLAVETLEDRTLLSVIPVAQVTGQIDISPTGGNHNTPSVAVDRHNPQNLVAVYTRNDPPNLGPANIPVIVEATYSTNGGLSWNSLSLPFPLTDPASSKTNLLPFPDSTNASVAFDRKDNFYIVYSEHRADQSSGAIVLQKFSLAGGFPTQVIKDQVLYEWTVDAAINPVVTVDDNPPTFTDPTTNVTQTDPQSGTVYVAWSTNNTAPTGAKNFNPNSIKVLASTDGGNSFSTQVYVNDNFNFGAEHDAAPQLAVSGGTADGRVTPGQLSVVYDDINSARTPAPPFDVIRYNSIQHASGYIAQGQTGPIVDATAGASGQPDVTGITQLTATVNITDPNFTTITDLNVAISLVHPTLGEVSIQLIRPGTDPLNQRTITLFNNQINGLGVANTNVGITGANMGDTASGIPEDTVFDDFAPRNIRTTSGAAAPFTGHFQTENLTLGNFFGLTAAQINGTWTLVIKDFRHDTSPVQFVRDWSLHLTSMPTRGSQIIAFTPILGAMTAPFPLTPVVSPDVGISPAPVIASDNTLGSFSPYQGMLYLAYVGRYSIVNTGNPTDNTDIFLVTSSDGGVTWSAPVQLNTDSGVADGFSEADNNPFTGHISGRPQFEPALAVDQSTGTLVATWYDARNDASRARVARYITASTDGGQTFNAQTFLNAPQTAFDEITRQNVTLGPIPDNISAGNPTRDKTFGFGDRQAIAVADGHVVAVWSGNQNGGFFHQNAPDPRLDIISATANIAAGPRILSSTMGPVSAPLNNTLAPDGTRLADTFNVQFDRPVDPATFTPSAVTVFFSNADPTDARQISLDVLSVTPLDSGTFGPAKAQGATLFQIKFDPTKALTIGGTYIGTYSYSIAPLVQDRIRDLKAVLIPIQTQTFSANNVNVPIPDVGTATSQLAVSGIPANQIVTHATVTININHTFDEDLVISLIAPNGQRVALSNNNGFNGHNYTNTTFDDAATVPISSGTAPFTGTFKPDSALSQLNGSPPNGTWTLQVDDVFFQDVGTILSWSLTLTTGTVSSITTPGNFMDQDADGTAGNPATDFYAIPRPLGGVAFHAPYDQTTQPLIVTGPVIIATHVIGNPATPDNLVLNGTVSSITVAFDRNIKPSTFTPSQIIRMMGPTGSIGPGGTVPASFVIQPNPHNTDPDPNNPRTYMIHFMTPDGTKPLVLNLSGTYTLTLGSGIQAASGNLPNAPAFLDTNQNAGLAKLRQASTQTTSVVYSSADTPQTVGDPAKSGFITTSTITVPDDFLIQNINVQLSITYAHDPDLEATLIAPNGTRIELFANVGANGTQANFTNTVFDDSTFPITPITSGGPPFTGRFNPQVGKGADLSSLTNTSSKGAWILEIKDDVAGTTGTLQNWSLTLFKAIPPTGLGEQIADQAEISFRIFTLDPTNPLSHNTWTSVGPAANGTGGGRVGGIAVDPADPSGNTVYVAGAEGGIWKTTNFLTNAPQGPTYVPLTNFGPTFATNIGGIAVFAHNNDTTQSIVFAATGFGDSGQGQPGVGFLRSTDGGATWTLLDSTTNVDGSGKTLPLNSTLRDHIFVGMNAFKVVVDPRPTPSGEVIVYAAMSGRNGGIWRSLDTGKHWQLMRAGQATDVVLDPNSGHVNAIDNPTGNLDFVYGAFAGDGVYFSPNRGTVWNQLLGGVGDPLIQDGDHTPNSPIPVTPPSSTPNGAHGRIVLVKPDLTGTLLPDGTYVGGNPAADLLYQGWLYAIVVDTNSHVFGIYLTKDFGQNWTKVRIPTLPPFGPLGTFPQAVPTNDNVNNADYDVGGGGNFTQGNYDIAAAIDPNNPNILYVGGTADGQPTGLIRVDVTGISDPHAFFTGNDKNDGGTLRVNATSPISLRQWPNGPNTFVGNFFDPVFNPMVNLIRDPFNPFNADATVFVSNTAAFANTGSGVKWTPFDIGGTDQHRWITIRDPQTGLSRLIIGDDQGIFSAVDLNGVPSTGGISGNPEAGGGSANRNGNLGIAQFYYGASQPSSAAAQIAGALFYSGVQDGASDMSAPNVLDTGNIAWTSDGQGDGGGVATDQTGTGTFYQYKWPCCGGNGTSFFQVNETGRTFGLLQQSNPGLTPDPQWPYGGVANFAVNPIDPNQMMISSFAGRIFGSADGGRTWVVIGNPANLDGTQSVAMAYGSPQPNDPTGALNDFLYVGTQGGGMFNTFTGGGASGNQWTDISRGGTDPTPGYSNIGFPGSRTGFPIDSLDGSPVQAIVTNPTRGSREAYAVVAGGTAGSFIYTPPTTANTILEGTSQSFSINVSTDLYVGQLSVTINLANGAPPPGEFSGALTAPDGEVFQLFSGASPLTNTTFADLVNLPLLSSAVPPYTGTFHSIAPYMTNRYQLANDFYGKNMRGTWTLTLTDLGDLGAAEPDGTPGTLNSFSLNWTSLGGVYHTMDSSQGGWKGVSEGFFRITIPAFGDAVNFKDAQPISMHALQADWRYAIPNSPAQGSGTHPVLYAGGQGGIYRSIDGGLSWTLFPNSSLDGAVKDGGLMPNVNVTDLTLALGNVNPTTGHPIVLDPVTGAKGPDVLMASTFGQGSFAIRVAPLVIPSSLQLDPNLPKPKGSTGPIPGSINALTPVIDGQSEESAFNNTVKIELFDVTNGVNNPVNIGVAIDANGNLLKDANGNPIPYVFTDANGNFLIEVKAGYFKSDGSTDGPKIFALRATDAAGAIGPMTFFNFTLNTTPIIHATSVHLDANGPLPPNQGGSDSGLALPTPGALGTFTDLLTNVTRPIIDGTIDQSAPTAINLYDVTNPNNPIFIGSGTTDINGNFSIQVNPGFYLSDGSTDGVHIIQVVAPHLPTNSNTVNLQFTLETTPPATPPAPQLSPSSDSGASNSDHITNVTTPTFFGTGEPSAQVRLYASNVQSPNNLQLEGLDLVDSLGHYTVQVSLPMADGTYSFTVQLSDLAGNVSGMSGAASPLVTITTRPPSTPTLQLDPAFITGNVANNVTAANPVRLLGTTDPNTTDVINDNGTQIDSFSQTNGNSFARMETLNLGDNTLTVVATDVAGNTATSAPLVVRIDPSALDPDHKFIRQIYFNALGRTGTLAEWNLWEPLMSLPNGRLLVVNGIERSGEARDRLVKGWYQTYLGRPALNGEEAPWVNFLVSGATEEQALSMILATGEYFNRSASLTGSPAPSNATFVKALYLQLLSRTPSDGEVNFWVGAIGVLGRQGVAANFLSSLEYREDVVRGYYVNLLLRPTAPAQSEVDAWAMSSLDITSIRVGFESSREFYFRITGFLPS